MEARQHRARFEAERGEAAAALAAYDKADIGSIALRRAVD
jgi:hypothetical protein